MNDYVRTVLVTSHQDDLRREAQGRRLARIARQDDRPRGDRPIVASLVSGLRAFVTRGSDDSVAAARRGREAAAEPSVSGHLFRGAGAH